VIILFLERDYQMFDEVVKNFISLTLFVGKIEKVNIREIK